CSLPIALTLVFVLLCLLFLLTRRRPPSSSLVPYTTLFRSLRQGRGRPRPVGRVHGRDHCCDRQGRLQGHALRVLRHRHRWSASTDRKSTRLNSSHVSISYAVFCLKKKNKKSTNHTYHRKAI